VLTRDALVDVVSVTRRSTDDDDSDSPIIPVDFTYRRANGIPPDDIATMASVEAAMRSQDEYEERVDLARNELESYIFTLLNGLRGDLRPFVVPGEVDDCEAAVGNAFAWFDEHEFERMSVDEYTEQLNGLRSFGDVVLRRKRLHESLPDVLRAMRERAWRMLDGVKAAGNGVRTGTLADEIAAFAADVEAKEKELEELERFVMPKVDAEGKLRALEKRMKKLPQPKQPEMKPEAKAEVKPEVKPEVPAEEKQEQADEEAQKAKKLSDLESSIFA
jgi:hypothetical protein